MRKPFTKGEIVVCTYIARFGHGVFDEKSVTRLENRSESSVKMKVQNIAAMLKEEGYGYSPEVSPLSGVTTGEKGRRTNWDMVSSLVDLEKTDLKAKCKMVFNR